MIVLTKNERRALFIVGLILAISAVVEWIGPHKTSTKQFDYSLQDSLFKVLSQDTNRTAPSSTTTKPKITRKKTATKPLQPHSININTADAQTLEKLPRIGPKTAQAILQYRQTHGPFKTIDELDNVKGIGPKTIERIRPFIFCQTADSTTD